MKIIGITGPTGAGKTTALNVLEQLGGVIVDCDAVYHRLLEADLNLQRELQERFGTLTDEQGEFDRKKLGGVVFCDPAALDDLNAIVWPYIGRAVEERLAQARRSGARAAAVDGITLIESGLAARCDTTVAVVAPEEERVRRICLREGISEEYARARVAAQKTGDWFGANCEHILVNNYRRPEDFALRARQLLEQILTQE